jgi:class 3 adenylate cyclase
MKNGNDYKDVFLEKKIDPIERAFFIEKTGVTIRWILTITFLIIQFVKPIVSYRVFFIGFPIAVAYNFSVKILLQYKSRQIVAISYFTGIMDILVSLVLIYLSAETDVYLWYFVLLVSHAARYGFIGSILSPVLFSTMLIGIVYFRGISIPFHTLLIRSLFFIITGIVSGYLAREEHRRFRRILKQQHDIFSVQQKRKEMRDMLQRYLSYNLVEELLKHPDTIKLGGARQKVTVLFADISGFTRLLSVVEPEKVIGVLNEYLTEMTNIIFTHGGMVDKYVGDAVIGIFGAPYPTQDDSFKAVFTALEMQKRLKQMQRKWKSELNEMITARIAVNTGEVILGNIGSPKRMDYTAIGDPVNVASRLQAIAELGRVVISRSTYNENKGRFRVKNLGKVELKGKKEPVEVYEVTSTKEGI